MKTSWKISVAAVVLSLAVGVGIGMNLSQPAFGTAQQPPSPPGSLTRYAVIHTEGTNIAVTDNKTNIVYYYTTDHGAEPGSDLKLRGTLDLSKVGDQVLRPKLFKKAK
jgi:hypothetical protein